MPKWEKMTVGDLCDTISDTYRGDDKEVVLINTSDVLEGKVLNHQVVENKNLKGQFKKTFKENDILYSEIRPANKRYAFVDFGDTDNYIASTKLMVLRPRKDVVRPRFLFSFLSSKSVLEELQQLAETRSGTFPQITFSSELAPTSINVPDLETQDRIVGILDVIERKISTNAKINKNLLEQATALYGKCFPYSTSDNLPPGWRVGTIGEIVEIHDSKRIPLSGAQRAKMEKRIYPYYGAASLMDYVDEYIFDGKYLLLGEDGTVVDDAGYPIIQYVWGQFWVNNHAHILTGKLGFNVESLLLLFKCTPVKSIVTGAVQPKISQANLRSIQVVIPPLDELDSFNELIRPMFDQIRQNHDQNKALAAMRDALLPKLMSGELDVSEVNI